VIAKRAELLQPLRQVASLARDIAFGSRHPLARGEDVRPFFIVGSGRSGSTLLRRILLGNPEVHIPPEMVALSESIRVYRRRRARAWPDLVDATLAAFEAHPGFAELGVSLRPLADELAVAPEETRSLALVLDALYRTHGRARGRAFTRWGDKTPLNAFHLPAITAVFPRAQSVHVLRDGVDAARSYLRAGLQPDLGAAALRWRESVAAVRGFMRKRPGACREIRYEELVAQPSAVVAGLCAFLDLGFDPSMLEARDRAGALADVARHPHLSAVFEPIGVGSIGRGRRDLAPVEAAQLQRLIGADLARLGYPPAA
jgi:hypothetical protein